MKLRRAALWLILLGSFPSPARSAPPSPSAAEHGPGKTTQSWNFEVATTDLPQFTYGASAWGDFDNDGDLDLVVSGARSSENFTRVYRNTAGSFADVGAGLPGLVLSSVAWGDFDRDGDLDLFLAGYDGAGAEISRIYRNDNGTFTDVDAGLPGVSWGSAAWGDFDNDGDLDLLLTGASSGGAIARVYRNDTGVFQDASAGLPGVRYSSVAWSDYDGDGDLDVLITGLSAIGPVGRFYRNNGGSFTPVASGLVSVDHSSVAVGDYDADGHADIVLNGHASSPSGTYVTHIYKNYSGAFGDVGGDQWGTAYGAVSWSDINCDGNLDFAFTGIPAYPGEFFMAGAAEFHSGSFSGIPCSIEPTENTTLSWGDYDNDGDQDLFQSGDGLGSAQYVGTLFRNLTAVVNAPPTAPSGLSFTTDATHAVFGWSAATDDHTPAAGLSYNLRVGTTPGGGEIVSPMSAPSGFRLIPAMGNAGERLSWSMPLAALGGQSIYWTVQAIDGANLGSAFAPEQSLVAGVRDPSRVAASFAAPVPNPFRSRVRFAFDTPHEGRVTLRVCDVAGRTVRTLVDRGLGAGHHEIAWNGDDDDGRRGPAGVYFGRLTAGSLVLTRRVLRIE